MFGRNKTPQADTPQADTPHVTTPQVELTTLQLETLSLTELVSIHAAAVVDKKAKEKIWDDAWAAHRDAIAKLSHLDVAIVNSDATRQRIRALNESADIACMAYINAKNYSNKTLAAISA